jgi:hypothetical protein
MKALCKLFVLLLASALLASCGGGGGGSNSAFGGNPGDDTTVSLSATTQTLPICVAGPSSDTCDYPGSPYIAEMTVTWRHKDGQLVAGTSTVTVSAAPVTTISFSKLLDPGETPGPNDSFHALEGSGPINVTAGVGTVFVHASNVPGTGVITVTAIDPASHHTITQQMTFTVAGAAPGLPASVFLGSSNDVYVSGSNGPQSSIITAAIADGSGAQVTAPSGTDNVLFEIIGPAGTDARLSGTNAAGQTSTGTSVSAASHNGIATITFLSGAKLGPVQVKATADHADNNTDNGISDPISATATVVVTDGLMFSIKITNPAVDANMLPVIGTASSSGSTTPSPVYAVPVTAIAQDRQGKPVLAGTVVGFGLIDAPVFGFPDQGSGTFELSGNDGNTQEGGTLFTAPTGHFTTAGGGAGPGDALVVFGLEVPNHVDDDLESARTVQHVNNAGSLNVTQPFNLNDTTGVSVDSGNDIPYVIGRASAGNIDASGVTGTETLPDGVTVVPSGVVQVVMRYPQSRIGQNAVVWATGNGANQSNGVAKTVTDAIRTRYLGVGPAVLTAVPQNITGNTTQVVTVCLNDSVGSPIPGVVINFEFDGLSPATGKVNGVTGSGALPPTGASGCVDVTVVTAGVQPGSGPTLVFSVGGLSATVTITVNGAILTANPTSIFSGASASPPSLYTVDLKLTDGSGNIVVGATITGSCASSGGGSASVDSPWTTGANGHATAIITASGFCVNPPGPAPTATCTYTYTNGTVTTSATTTIQGQLVGAQSPSCTP